MSKEGRAVSTLSFMGIPDSTFSGNALVAQLCRHPHPCDMEAIGDKLPSLRCGVTAEDDLGCVKTKPDLVVMPSEGRMFAFFCSERDHKPQNSGCGYTRQSFHT